MKIIIAGSRGINSIEEIYSAVQKSKFNVSEVVSGGARGVDLLGEVYARKENKNIKRFPAEWDKFGKSAGYKRNTQMAEYSDGLIAIWDGKSSGTKHMIDEMRKRNKKVFVHIVN